VGFRLQLARDLREQRAGFNRMERYSTFTEQVKETKAQAARISDPGEARGKIHCGMRGSGRRQHSLELLRNLDRLHRLHSRPQSLYKQGKFLPGTHMPIYAPRKIEETKPDYVLILPWNFKDEIMAQMAHIRKWAGRFVTPIPQVKVYP
jgi:hypothetical protein